jgi:hypothetical protein
LREYDGSDPNKTILVSVNGRIYNVWRVTERSVKLALSLRPSRVAGERCVRVSLILTMRLAAPCRLTGSLAVRVWRYIRNVCWTRVRGGALPDVSIAKQFVRPRTYIGREHVVHLCAFILWCYVRSFESSDLDRYVENMPGSAQSLLSEWMESYEMKVRTNSLLLMYIQPHNTR